MMVLNTVGSVVVKKAWNRHVSKSPSCPAAALVAALKSGIRRTTNRPGICSAFFCEENAVKATSATSAVEIHCWVSGLKMASVYLIVVQACSSMVAMAVLMGGLILTVTDTLAPPRMAAQSEGRPQ